MKKNKIFAKYIGFSCGFLIFFLLLTIFFLIRKSLLEKELLNNSLDSISILVRRTSFYILLTSAVLPVLSYPFMQAGFFLFLKRRGSFLKKEPRFLLITYFLSIQVALATFFLYLDQNYDIAINLFRFLISPLLLFLVFLFGIKRF